MCHHMCTAAGIVAVKHCSKEHWCKQFWDAVCSGWQCWEPAGTGSQACRCARWPKGSMELSQGWPCEATVSPVERDGWPTSLALALGPDQGLWPVPNTAGLSGLASLALLTPKELQVCLLLVTSLQQILESGCKGFVSTEDTKQGERGPNVMEIEASVQKVPAPCETGGVGTAPVHLLIHT